MKKTLIGGFVSLIGTIWALASINIAGNNLVSAWSTPPGRFLTTLAATGLLWPFILAIVATLGGMLLMGIEYFKKES